MEYHLPKKLNCENDLKNYENYIEQYNQPKTITNRSCQRYTDEYEEKLYSNDMTTYLKKHIGKLVKVESLFNNRLDIRIGTIIDIGCDHIVLKLHSCCCSLVVPINSIKYITVAHDNNLRKMLNK